VNYLRYYETVRQNVEVGPNYIRLHFTIGSHFLVHPVYRFHSYVVCHEQKIFILYIEYLYSAPSRRSTHAEALSALAYNYDAKCHFEGMCSIYNWQN